MAELISLPTKKIIQKNKQKKQRPSTARLCNRLLLLMMPCFCGRITIGMLELEKLVVQAPVVFDKIKVDAQHLFSMVRAETGCVR